MHYERWLHHLLPSHCWSSEFEVVKRLDGQEYPPSRTQNPNDVTTSPPPFQPASERVGPQHGSRNRLGPLRAGARDDGRTGHGCGDTGGHVHAGQGCGHHGHIPQRDPRDARVADLLCCGAAARGRVDGRRHAGAGAGRGRRRKGDHVALLRRDEARLGGPHQAVHRRCGNDHGLRRDAGKRLHDGPRGLWPRTRLAAFAGRRWDLHGLRNGRLLFRALPEDLPREERLCRIGWLARRPRLPPCRRRPILDAPRLPDSSFSGAFFLPLSMFVAYIALLLYYIQFRSTNLYDIFPFLRPIRSLLGRGDHGKDKAGVNIGVFGLAAGAGAKANGKPASAPVPSGNLNTSAEYASLLNQHLVTICTGFMFGYGLVFSGMGDTERVQAFLDPLGFGGKWDITLMFVMGSSVMTNLLAYHALRDSNLDVQILHTPEGRPIPLKEVVQWGPVGGNMNINRDLVLGSVMFGLGWGALGVAGSSVVPGSPERLIRQCAVSGPGDRIVRDGAVPDDAGGSFHRAGCAAEDVRGEAERTERRMMARCGVHSASAGECDWRTRLRCSISWICLR